MKGYDLFFVYPSRVYTTDEEYPDGLPQEIRLGELDRGRELVIIPLIGDGAYFRPKETQNGVVLVRLQERVEQPAPCLAVIDAEGGYSKGRHYSIPDTPGITRIARGYSAHGIAGRAGGAEHALCIVQPGTEFRLYSKYASHWHRWDGYTWTIETPAERAARLSLEEVESGGGVWL